MGPGFRLSGGDVDTLPDVIEALAHLHEIPERERGTGWYAYRETLQAKRRQLTAGDWKRHETAVVRPDETR